MIIHTILKNILQRDILMINKVNSMAKASLLYIIGTTIGQGMTFLGTIVFVRLMTRYEYGIYSTYYSVMSIVVVFVGSNLYVSLQNAYIDYKDEIYQYRKSVLVLSVITCAIVGSILIIANIVVFPRIPMYMTLFVIVHGYSFFLVNYRMYSDNMEFNYKNKTFLLIFPPMFQLIISWIFVLVFCNNMLPARIVGASMGVAICGAIAFVSIITHKGHFFVIEYWKYALKISVPSILMSVSYMIMQQCDKVIITALIGAEETAVYSVVYYIGFAITAVSGAVSSIFQAWLYRAISKENYEQVPIVQKWYLFFMALTECVILMFAPELIKLISPKEYWNFEYVAPFVLSASITILYGLYTNVGLYYKKTGMTSICVMASAVVNVILNYISVPRFGAVAACYTTVVAYVILLITTKILSDKMHRGLYKTSTTIVFFSYSIVLCILFDFLCDTILIRYMIYMIIVLVLGVYLLINKKIIYNFLKNDYDEKEEM